ncbi:MAG: sigma-70 factor domain-containing protein, partial [Fusobacteriaceae bacterium]
MKRFIKNEKVLLLLRRAMENKVITYEEINEELKDEFDLENIEFLISGMLEQGIEIQKKGKAEKKTKKKNEEKEEELVKTKKTKGESKKTKKIELDEEDDDDDDDDDDDEDGYVKTKKTSDLYDSEGRKRLGHNFDGFGEFNPNEVEQIPDEELVSEDLFNITGEMKVDEPIKMYLREIGQIPLLSHADELKYAKAAYEKEQYAIDQLVE